MRFEFVRAQGEINRCAKSDCPYERVENTDFCPRHGANKQLEKRANKLRYDLKVERVRQRVDLLSVDRDRYRLDEELALLRITLEDTINAITTRSDADYALFQGSDTIRNLITSISKLTQDCVTQSRALGLLMTADQFLEEVQKIIDVISEEIEDEETVIRIAERIGRAFGVEGSLSEGDQPTFQLDYAAPSYSGSEGQDEGD